MNLKVILQNRFRIASQLHFKACIPKGSRPALLGIGIVKLRNHLSPSVVTILLQAFVLSQLRYNIISVYSDCTGHIGKLLSNKKDINYALKVIYGLRKCHHVSDLLARLGWLRAEQIASHHNVCLIHKVLISGKFGTLAAYV